jgi:hypothetical protein
MDFMSNQALSNYEGFPFCGSLYIVADCDAARLRRVECFGSLAIIIKIPFGTAEGGQCQGPVCLLR